MAQNLKEQIARYYLENGDGKIQSCQIHVETQAKNSYNNQPIYPLSPILLDLSMPPLDNIEGSIFKISSHMGTYNCNWIAYRTQLYLNRLSGQQTTFHLFFHLPRRTIAARNAKNIVDLLIHNQVIK